jgi:hypothetical protein
MRAQNNSVNKSSLTINRAPGATLRPPWWCGRCLTGYTLLEATSGNAWNATLYDNLSFDFIRDT